MPRRRRSRRPKQKHNDRNHFGGKDGQKESIFEGKMRHYDNEETSLETSEKVPQPKELLFMTPNSDLILDDPTPPRLKNFTYELSRQFNSSSIKKRRSVSREPSLGFKRMVNVSDISMELRGCHSSTFMEVRNSKITRSNSSMAKLHSPGIEKVKLKSNISTQTPCDLIISETPRINKDALFEFDYSIQANTPSSCYRTPIKRLRLSKGNTFDTRDSALCIQDLNNLNNEHSGQEALNRSKILNGSSLKKLQNFNEIILNTSQDEILEFDDGVKFEEEEMKDLNVNVHELSGTEISFFTPQLYNGKSASTPILEKEIEAPFEVVGPMSNRAAEIFKHDIGVQACINGSEEVAWENVEVQRKKRAVLNKSPKVVCYKGSPPKRVGRLLTPRRSISLEVTDSDTIATIESCAKIFSRIKKFHGKYSAKIPAKIVEICAWLGTTLKKGLTSFFKLYTEQKPLNDTIIEIKCEKCSLYLSHISTLTSTVQELSRQVNAMKEDNIDKSIKLATLNTEMNHLKLELGQLDLLKKELQDIKERLNTTGKPLVVPPPPPPPPLPLLRNFPTISTNKSATIGPKKKVNESSRPVISLDDILQVKLRKATDRPVRRGTDPFVGATLKQIRLKPINVSRPMSPSTPSSVSSSPRSSLTRILTHVDTNVRRVKRLQRTAAHSFDDFSRRNRRERENYDFTTTPVK